MPSSTAPCSRSRATAGASSSHGRSGSIAREPRSVGQPSVRNMSLIDDRHAVQQAARLAPSPPRRRLFGLRERRFLVDEAERVERRVGLGDPVQRGLGGLDGGQLACTVSRRPARSRSVSGVVGHQVLSVRLVPRSARSQASCRPRCAGARPPASGGSWPRTGRPGRLASRSRPRTCAGRRCTFGIDHSGDDADNGSVSNTSSAAPAIVPVLDGLDQVVVDHQLAAAHVDQPRGRPHRGERGRVEHAPGLLGQRRGERRRSRRRGRRSAEPRRSDDLAESGSPGGAFGPTPSTRRPAARSSLPMARPIGPVPTTSALRSGDPFGLPVLPTVFAWLSHGGREGPWRSTSTSASTYSAIGSSKTPREFVSTTASRPARGTAAGRRRRWRCAPSAAGPRRATRDRTARRPEVPDEQARPRRVSAPANWSAWT